MQEQTFYFICGPKIFKIPTIFKHLPDISPKVSKQLIFGINHSYEIESKVNIEVFEEFLEYLTDDKFPNITFDNIIFYKYLSDEFEILKSTIQAQIEEYGEYLVHINNLRFNLIEDFGQSEAIIARNLDDYIEKHAPSLFKIRIQSLYNIFNHPYRNLLKHNEAYLAIKQAFEREQDPSIFILLLSLDADRMNEYYVEECFSLRESRFHYMVKINYDYLCRAIDLNLSKDNAAKQHHIEELEIDNAYKQEEINNKQQQIDDLEKYNAAKQNDIDNKRQQIDYLEKDNAAKQEDINNKQQQINELEKDNAAKQEDINNKQQQIDELEKDNAYKQEDINNKQRQIDELEKDNAYKQEDINNKQRQIDELEKYNVAKQDDINDKQYHIEELEKDNAAKQDDINNKQELIDEIVKENARLQEEINNKQQWIDEPQKCIALLNNEINNKQQAIEELKRENANKEDILHKIINLISKDSKPNFEEGK